MVDISRESIHETDARLRRLIRMCELRVLDTPYRFEEMAVQDTPPTIHEDALAVVRDDDVWSQLVPAEAGVPGSFAIWRLHFPIGYDNSGFVGWLATYLKKEFGTGVIVICGHNGSRGGIYDFWGCPTGIRDPVLTAVRSLMRTGG